MPLKTCHPLADPQEWSSATWCCCCPRDTNHTAGWSTSILTHLSTGKWIPLKVRALQKKLNVPIFIFMCYWAVHKVLGVTQSNWMPEHTLHSRDVSLFHISPCTLRNRTVIRPLTNSDSSLLIYLSSFFLLHVSLFFPVLHPYCWLPGQNPQVLRVTKLSSYPVHAQNSKGLE